MGQSCPPPVFKNNHYLERLEEERIKRQLSFLPSIFWINSWKVRNRDVEHPGQPQHPNEREMWLRLEGSHLPMAIYLAMRKGEDGTGLARPGQERESSGTVKAWSGSSSIPSSSRHSIKKNGGYLTATPLSTAIYSLCWGNGGQKGRSGQEIDSPLPRNKERNER